MSKNDAYRRMIAAERAARAARTQSWEVLENCAVPVREATRQFQALRDLADAEDAEALAAWRELNDCHSAADLSRLQGGGVSNAWQGG